MSDLMVKGMVPVDRGVQGIANRLTDERGAIDLLTRRLAAAKKRRNLLILKLVTAGLTERTIAPIAGVTSAAVNQIKRRGRDRSKP